MSQLSQSSVPSELTDHQDHEFIEELNIVDELYFTPRNINISDDNFDEILTDQDVNYESDIESESESKDNQQFIDPSEYDLKERSLQRTFKTETCGCMFFNGNPSINALDFDDIVEYREHCLELSREELDLVIKAELFSHRRSGDYTTAKKHKVKDRERPFQEFYLKGQRVCRDTFCFTHGIEKKKLLKIARSLDEDGLKPRVHGGVGRVPSHSLTFTDRERVKTFICTYASDNALPLSGRLPNYRNVQVLLLPSDKSVADIHKMYQDLANLMNFRTISLRTFQRLWHDLCPYITVMHPCTDLCQSCQSFTQKLSTSGNLSEEEKQQILDDYNTHVTLAKRQSDYYRKQVAESKNAYTALECNDTDGCGQCGTFHFSWDYAQTVHYPHHAQQVGPIYFKTPRKCHVFGMCSEASGQQTFYLVDEAENPGKGSNSVTSLVHHYLANYGHGETNAQFHFDNCCGQNKNNVVLWYGLWRVIVGLHKHIEYSMMIAGHTKFEPDWHFGIWKLKWRKSSAETMEEIAENVKTSSRNEHNIPQLVTDEDKPVVFYDWKTYLQQFFKPLKYISKYHHFLFESEKPGVVQYKQNCDSDILKSNLLRNKSVLPTLNDLPTCISCKGLSAGRQWYLYENIRQHCVSDAAKEKIYPKPCVTKEEAKAELSNLLQNDSKKHKSW